MPKEIDLLRLPGVNGPLIAPANQEDTAFFVHCSVDSTAVATEEVFLEMMWPVMQTHGYDGFQIEDAKEDDSYYLKF